MRAMLGAVAFGWLAALAMGQTGAPDIGRLMLQSPLDLRNVQTGCIHSYDAKAGRFVCAPTNLTAGTVLDVTLSVGTLTVVRNGAVMAGSRVRCGCEAAPGAGTTASCSGGAEWTPRVHVRSVSAGSFEIVHGYATGSQVIRCVVET